MQTALGTQHCACVILDTAAQSSKNVYRRLNRFDVVWLSEWTPAMAWPPLGTERLCNRQADDPCCMIADL